MSAGEASLSSTMSSPFWRCMWAYDSLPQFLPWPYPAGSEQRHSSQAVLPHSSSLTCVRLHPGAFCTPCLGEAGA